MSKKTLRNLNLQEEDQFVMSPLETNPKPYYKEKVSVRLETSLKKRGKASVGKCYPIFNNDGLYYTPTFLLPSEKDAYQILDSMLKNQYIEKLKNSQEKSTNLMTLEGEISTPCPNSKVCFVCKSSYTSYEEHIEQLGHQRNIKKSSYTEQIEIMCRQFSESNQPHQQPEKGAQPSMLLQFPDRSECQSELPPFPIPPQFHGFFQETPPLRHFQGWQGYF